MTGHERRWSVPPLLEALEDHGAEIPPAIDLGGYGNFVAFDDALADELRGSSAHIRRDEERDLVAYNFAIAQRQIARRRGHRAGQLLAILFKDKRQGDRVVARLRGRSEEHT